MNYFLWLNQVKFHVKSYILRQTYLISLVGGFKHFLFSIIYGIILPID